MKKVTNWLYNWAIKLPAWALCTVMTVSVVVTSMAILMAMLFVLLSVTKKVIIVSDFTIGVIFTLFSWGFLYFALCILDAFSDRLIQTEIENSKKTKDSENEDN